MDGGGEEADHLTAGDLDRRAASIAAALERLRLRGRRALLLYPPGLDFIGAFLGCLYAAAVAVPTYPPGGDRSRRRLRAIAADAQPAAVLTTEAIRSRIGRCGLAEIPELRGAAWLATETLSADSGDGWRDPRPDPESLAFLQYTSGSTSTPKGVMIGHGNLTHNEEMIRHAFGQSDRSVVVGWLPVYHDMGLIGNVLQPLYTGSRCILMSPMSFLQNPVLWLRAISRYRATTSGGPNFAYDLCVRKVTAAERRELDLSSWTVAFNGAEPVRAQTLDRFAAAFAECGFSRRAFFPCYGLAEATLFVAGGRTAAEPVGLRVDPTALEQDRAVPAEGGRRLVGCGRAWMDQEIRIVDPVSRRSLPEGHVGELWIAGSSVAHGYWNRRVQTARDFRARPADDPAAGPFLRSGDLGTVVGGELFVTGRCKDLIIIRGRNLYPQDIELTAELAHPALRPGSTAAFSIDRDGVERLVVACELSRRAGAAPDAVADAIRHAVAEEHEVPADDVVLVRQAALPKTSSGKIRRAACRQLYLSRELPTLASSRLAEVDSKPAAGREEAPIDRELLAAMAPEDRRAAVLAFLRHRFAEALEIPPAAVETDRPLTAQGLDSLAAVETRHALESKLGVAVPLPDLLRGLSLRQVTAEVMARMERRPRGSLAPRARRRSVPLSFAQEGLWFLENLEPGKAIYNLAGAIRLEGPVRPAALAAALREVVRRHEILRTTLPARGGRPYQEVSPMPPVMLPEVDLSGLEPQTRAATWRQLAALAARQPFDLARGPLMKTVLIRLRERRRFLLLTMHHTIADGWSLGILLREIAALYEAAAAGRPAALAALEVQYADYALWQRETLRGEALERLLTYWRRRLAGVEGALELPADRPRPARSSYRGARRSQSLPRQLCDALALLGRRSNATPFMVFLAALGTLLYRYSGSRDLAIGVPLSGRDHQQLGDLIGFFVNTTVMRLEIAGTASFQELVKQVREVAIGAWDHQDLPYERLVAEMQPERDPARQGLFQVLFSHQALPQPIHTADGLSLIPEAVDTGAAHFDLSLFVEETPRATTAVLRYRRDLYDATSAERLLRHYAAVLEAAVLPETRLAELPLLRSAERAQILIESNDTADPAAAASRPVPEQIAAWAETTPDAVAVVCEERRLTYGALIRRSQRWARRLRWMGVGAEDVVGVALERSADFVVAILAIQQAGAAYLGLDPSDPGERLAGMLEDAAANVLLVRTDLPAAGWHGRVLSPRRLDEAKGEGSLGRPSPRHLAYVVYTSGSTGRPKGVAVEHRQLSHYVGAVRRRLEVPCGTSFATVSTLAADLGNTSIFVAITSGGCLHVLAEPRIADADALGEYCEHRRINGLKIVPSHLAALTSGSRPERVLPLDWLILGGEAASWNEVERYARWGPQCSIFNHYGPAEATVGTAVYRYRGVPALPRSSHLPLGHPLANASVYVLDRRLLPVPLGVVGELIIGGDGVTRGYLGRPALTAGRFVPDAAAGVPGARCYRTGDLARLAPDGLFEFLGRRDRQLKIRGFRVEPGELEAVLLRHPAVRETVVTGWRDAAGELRLVAYVVTGEPTDRSQLLSFLRARLPEPMVPFAVTSLDCLPLTPNGKLDFAALPDPEPVRPAHGATPPAPRSPLEELVADVWAELLGRQRLAIDDHFFALGGHSLLATQAVARLRAATGSEVPLAALFRSPTVAAFARELEALTGRASPPIAPCPDRAAAPLSFSQERLWFLERLEQELAAYNLPYYAELEGPLDLAAFRRALKEIVRRHQELRATFPATEGRPRRVIRPAGDFHLTLADLLQLPAEARRAQALGLAAREGSRPFDLARGPLLRGVLVRLGTDEHVLLLTLHHIVSDAWSRGILVRELGVLYEAFREGRPSPLPKPALQYADFADWQRRHLSGETLAAQRRYWRRRLGGEPTLLDLPTDRPRPAAQSFRGALRRRLYDPELRDRLKSLGRRRGASFFMALLAGFEALLYLWTGQRRFNVGTPIANRTREEVEGLIGFFVNTVVLRSDLAGNPTFLDLLDHVRETTLGAYAHQDLPFEHLVEELQPDRSLAYTPLFQVMLVLQNAPMPTLRFAGLTLTPLELHNGTAKFDLALTLEEADQGLAASLEYNRDLFDATTAERLVVRFEHLLRDAAADPRQQVASLRTLSAAETWQVLGEWSDTGSPAAERPEFLESFASRVARSPDATALVQWRSGSAEQRRSYGELDRESNRLTHLLQARGAGPEKIVAVCLERSIGLVVALLAVLKAGAAYLPLDPADPARRRRSILEEARPLTVITYAPLAADFTGDDVLCLDTESDALAHCSAAAPAPPVLAESLAYVLYTSGSTGRPKGVMVQRASLDAYLAWADEALVGEQADVVPFVTRVSFDASLKQIFVPLRRGTAVHVLAPEATGDPRLITAALAGVARSGFNGVPGLWQAMLDAVERGEVPAPADLRCLWLGGERLPPELVRRTLALFPHVLVVNLYGLTETTANSTFATIETGDEVTLGRPIAGGRIRLLDRHGRPVPIGGVGEIHVGGRGVTRGYLGRPALTATKFVADLWGEAGARLYKTGDLGRFLADGRLEYLGRLDDQVQIRGVRVEPAEIESILELHPTVRESAVVVRRGDQVGERLAAYFTLARGDRELRSLELGLAELRDHLHEHLPDAMVPPYLMPLEELPRLPGGKVDRRALAALEIERPEGDGGDLPPMSPTEEIVAGIWAEVLGHERVGADDDFFALGGHSLLAAQILPRLQQIFRLELDLRSLFEWPTVAALARAIDEARSREAAPPAAAIRRAPRPAGGIPLSFGQTRLWMLDQMFPGRSAYNLPAAVRLAGRLDAAALEASLHEILRRHEVLRAAFTRHGGEPVQTTAAITAPILPVVDLQRLEVRGCETERLAFREARRPFDLSRGGLLRCRLLVLGSEEHVLLLNLHHIVADGWSIAVFIRELEALYESFSTRTEAALPELPVQYADYAVWQREWLQGETLESQMAYWRRRLADVPVLRLPTDRPRPADTTFRGSSVPFALPRELSDDLVALSRQSTVTLFMTLLAGFQGLLGALSGQTDVPVGCPVANRRRPEIEGLIGFFVNTLVMRGDLAGRPTFLEHLARVRESVLEADAHQDLPFEKLVEELHPRRHLGSSPLFQAALAFDVEAAAPRLPGLDVKMLELGTGEVQFELTLALRERREGLAGWMDFNADLYDHTTVRRWTRHLETLLAAAAADPGHYMCDLPLLTAPERGQVLTEWSGAGARAPDQLSVHELFAAQAAQRPDALAVAGPDGVLTYGELEQRSNQLARYLRRAGVGAQTRVAVCLERSPELIVALLGILKTGGAYVPIEAATPGRRLAFVAADARSSLLLSREDLAVELPESARVVRLDAQWREVAREDASPIAAPGGVDGDRLAYVVYTSGSTGKPKGVAIHHAGLRQLAAWHRRRYGLTPQDRTSLLAGLAFDAAVWEIWPTLSAGASLHLPPEPVRLSVPDLVAWIRDRRVTVCFLPTPIAELALGHEGLEELALRWLLTGGDRLRGRPDGSLPCHLVNHYGPSEATVVTTAGTVTPASGRSTPRAPSIGGPIDGVEVYVLDRGLRPMPVGASGEIVIGGSGVARGYLERPRLSAERFVPHPYGCRPGARFYRSGDRARWLPDGRLDFQGRLDDQIKLRGFRIEPGEIEVTLGEHPSVREAAVLLHQGLAAGPALVAFVVLETRSHEAPDELLDELRHHLRQHLPAPMVPALLVPLEELPLTPNGKVDRHVLSRHALTAALEVDPASPPRTPLEEHIARIWREVLGVEELGIHDNFFDLGGHSLWVTQVVSRLEETLERPLAPSVMIEHPSVAALAAALERASPVPEDPSPDD